MLVFMLVGAVAEVATIGAVLPFLALIADPNGIDRFPRLAAALPMIGLSRGQNLLIPAAAGFVAIAAIAAVIRLALTWYSQKFVFRLGYDIGTAVYRELLHKPYSYHIAHNSSEVVSAIQKVQNVVNNMLMPVIQGITATVIALFVLAGLMLVSPGVAFGAALGFGLIYVAVAVVTRRQMRRSSKIVAQSATQRIKTVQEGVGAIRDVILDHAQDIYLSKFARVDSRMRDAQAHIAFNGAAPRFVVEAAGMMLIAGLAVVLSYGEGGLANALPVLGVLAIGAQRLLPLLQQMYAGYVQLVGQRQTLIDVLRMMPTDHGTRRARRSTTPPTPFREALVFEGVGFRFAADAPRVLRGVDLTIRKGARIGFIGKTGSGKSTIMDLAMGLLTPTEGRITIDGAALDGEARRGWQAQVAHVPQAIYLADTSILENIAFGMADGEADLERARIAAAKADIADFIESLPEKYATEIGERGVRLSGGQRQRLGIARALYKQASVLVFDEATSALDDATEASVMQAIEGLSDDLTILIIAHRLSTLRGCDRIYRLANGVIAQQGSYAEVVEAA
jgi:ABC-type bacteriocin/lantibiotic exporter with double-glycine peptidase domain